MKVAIVGTVGVPAKYGGFETLVHQLVRRNDSNVDFIVYCSGRAYKKTERLTTFHNAELVYIPISSNGLRSIIYDIISMVHALFKARTILVLGVSGMIVLPLLKFFCRKHKFIVHIDGLEWKRNKWSKSSKYFLKKSESIAVRYADEVIADNKAIQDYVAAEYNSTSALIAYGADHIKTTPQSPAIRLGEEYGFSVCRIEPENNVHIVLEAVAANPQRKLKFVGNWQNSKYGKELFDKYCAYPNIELLDPIYDQKQLDVIRGNCWYYIHGHSAGGTNPSLAEAMFLQLPVVAFDVSYNRETTQGGALYFSSKEELSTLLENVHTLPLQECGQRMKSIADKRYTWDTIFNQYFQLFLKVQPRVSTKPVVFRRSIHYYINFFRDGIF